MAEMSENDFYKIAGDSYRGSRYANFVGGGVDPQGNVSSAATENAASKVGTNASASDAPPTPINASKGLTGTQSMADMAVGAALPFAGNVVGEVAGQAMAAGAPFSTAFGEGVSSLAGKVSGGLVGTTGASATVTNAALGKMGGQFGPATTGQLAEAGGGATGSAGGFGSSANIGAAAGSGIATAAAVLLTGGGVEKAAKSGVGTAAGTYIGTALGGPIGGFIGGSIGGMVGGRVICTQLVADGLLSKADQRLDMEFTFHALSSVHVRGYLFWARAWVEKMKKNPALRDRTHKVVVWRLNEIKYQLGIVDRPDWRGKIVRLIGENLCFIIGMFLEDTAESVIYKKENRHVST